MLWYVNCHNTSPTHADLARSLRLLCPHSPLVFSFMIQTVETDVKIQVFPSSPWRAPPTMPPPTRGCSSSLQQQTDLSHAHTHSLFIPSRPYSCSPAPTLSAILPCPVCSQSTHFSPICPSILKTGVTEISRLPKY